MQPVLWAAAGTGFTCLMTVLGASMVFFFRKRVTDGGPADFPGLCRRRDGGCLGVEPADPRH